MGWGVGGGDLHELQLGHFAHQLVQLAQDGAERQACLPRAVVVTSAVARNTGLYFVIRTLFPALHLDSCSPFCLAEPAMEDPLNRQSNSVRKSLNLVM